MWNKWQKSHFLSQNLFSYNPYPPEKTFIGTSSLLARGSRVLLTDPLFTLGETGYLKLACYVSLWHKIHFGVHFTLSAQRGQDFATMKFNPWRQLFHYSSRLIRVQYLFDIGLWKKMTKLIYNTKHWILKLQSWFLVSQVECWLHNLHVVYISRMLRAQFSRTSDHV